MNSRALVWFRNDLRISDNEALTKAIIKHNEILCVYCFDPKQFQEIRKGLPKTGVFRAKFLLETIEDLKLQLQNRGNDLFISLKEPEKAIPELCITHDISDVYFHDEIGTEESIVVDNLEKILFSLNINTHHFWGKTLFHRDDLSFPVNHCPDVFTSFRKIVEKEVEVRKTYPIPGAFDTIKNLPKTSLPSLFQLGHAEQTPDDRSAFPFKGGETEGLNRLREYIWEKELIKDYKETRNGLLGSDYSSKFSPWLANGSLSPRIILEEIKKYESQKIKNKSTNWLVFELIWRDFFSFQGQKLGKELFNIEGPKGLKKRWSVDEGLFDLWKKGKTGIPFIDANMIELNRTGFMSNRGRQNVASFLTKDLNINWIWGAEYFESMLIDHDVCSNYGNWQYVAGVGADPREDRYFNVLKQALTYDQKGSYTRHWIPELKSLNDYNLHRTFNIRSKDKIELGIEYPEAVMIPKSFSAYMN